MRGSSRDALKAGQEQLESLLAGRSVDPTTLGTELFGVVALLDSSAAVRRAFTDPSRTGADKAALVHQLLDGKVSSQVADVMAGLVQHRWGSAPDLTDAVEELAVQAVLGSAERGGRLDTVEDELFRFARSVAGSPDLRDAFSIRAAGADRKAALVRTLLEGKASPETVTLAVQAATAPRGLRTEQVLERYVEAAAERRDQLVAHVISAVPLTASEHQRLATALQRLYGRAPRLNVDVDPEVVGGLRVQIGGELIDGTMSGRLDEARRRLAG